MDDDDVQQFSLRWHNHQNSVVGALGGMLATGALSDVTLSASGGTLKAHRIVLAACSQYFAKLFKEVECSGGALVVVVGCEAAELRLLLSFMYTGEVTAGRRALPALLRLARALEVSGLGDADAVSEPLCLFGLASLLTPQKFDGVQVTHVVQESPHRTVDSFAFILHSHNCNTNPHITQPIPEVPTEPTSPINLEKSDSSIDFIKNETNSELCKQVTEVQKEPEYLSEIVDRNDTEKDKLSKLDQIVQNLYSTHRVGNYATSVPPPITSLAGQDTRRSSTCMICNKRLSNQYNLRVHMDTHAGRRHACCSCSHVSRSRDALRKHVAYRHGRGACE